MRIISNAVVITFSLSDVKFSKSSKLLRQKYSERKYKIRRLRGETVKDVERRKGEGFVRGGEGESWLEIWIKHETRYENYFYFKYYLLENYFVLQHAVVAQQLEIFAGFKTKAKEKRRRKFEKTAGRGRRGGEKEEKFVLVKLKYIIFGRKHY